MKILMVCLGNICRSPLAEGIMRKKILQHKLNWEVDSAATSTWHIGNSPDPRAISIAAKNKVDISQQRARQIKTVDLERFDLIYAMDDSNYVDILKLVSSSEQQEKVRLILIEGIEDDNNTDVPDPYWDDNGFEKVFSLLNDVCEKIIQISSPKN